MKLITLFEATKSAQLLFINAIAVACGAPKTSALNTRAINRGAEYAVKLNDKIKEDKARAYLRGCGFVVEELKASGGSTKGDFSSDKYGANFKHSNGTHVSVGTSFKSSPAKFFINLTASEEQSAEIVGSLAK